MKYGRGNKILERFNAGYLAVGEVARRFGVYRGIVTGLTEIYLNEQGEGVNPELIETRDKYTPYVKDPRAPRLELNEQGDTIVRAFIFAYRNRMDKIGGLRKESAFD
jgi:hypothetical protein